MHVKHIRTAMQNALTTNGVSYTKDINLDGYGKTYMYVLPHTNTYNVNTFTALVAAVTPWLLANGFIPHKHGGYTHPALPNVQVVCTHQQFNTHCAYVLDINVFTN